MTNNNGGSSRNFHGWDRSVPFNGGGKDDCLSGQGVSDCVCLPLLFR